MQDIKRFGVSEGACFLRLCIGPAHIQNGIHRYMEELCVICENAEAQFGPVIFHITDKGDSAAKLFCHLLLRISMFCPQTFQFFSDYFIIIKIHLNLVSIFILHNAEYCLM